MITAHASAPHPFTAGQAFLLRPRLFFQKQHAWEVHVSAADLVGLTQEPDAVRRLRARRGFLGDTPVNRALAEELRERPEEFGRVHALVLGADEIHLPQPSGPGGFPSELFVSGLECIDGLQRLAVIAEAAAVLGHAHLSRATVRLDIHCGRSRESVRRHFGGVQDRVNAATAQDGLIHCPNIRRLMESDWEREGSFEPWRGVNLGTRTRRYAMPEVTRGLACLAAVAGPEAAHAVATDEGLDVLWGAIGSALYLQVFHDRMSPLGVVRAVKAHRTARAALGRLPAKYGHGPGHLLAYAPDLVAREACRRLLPVADLHDERTRFDWHGVIERHLPREVERTAVELVRRYAVVHEALGGKPRYAGEADRLDVWRAILSEV
ncbi:hypothetical protein [Streptomyces sp. NPDC014746]|uniref:hypothetical protein n=1 Tax=Streptomyces sp. NPDC014746 TaxID=3364904 RepID=UPI0036FC804E